MKARTLLLIVCCLNSESSGLHSVRLLSSRNIGGQEGHIERRLTVTVQEGGAVRLHCEAQLQREESLHSVLWYFSQTGEPDNKSPIFRYLGVSEEDDPEDKKSAWLYEVKGKFSVDNLVDRLHLNAEDITIQPVHPSIIGQDTWFQITYTSSGTTRYFSCQNTKERDEWIQSLKKTLMLTEDRRRTDSCLKLGVLEGKGLSEKKKYYVEIQVDDKLYARTASKKMTTSGCFWGEHFEFADLPRHSERVALLVHKDKGGANGRKKPKKPVGRVRISVPSIKSRYMQEKWHQVDKVSRRESPSLRLKCQFQSVDILPLRDYEDFLYYLKDEYKPMCKMFEPFISVKVKEELSHSLMSVFHSEEIAEDVLAEIVADEISSVDNEHLTFRGNSIATKAMEAYIKLVGHRYLQSTLQSVVTEIILSDEVDLEVDPVKVNDNEALMRHRVNLRTVVKQVWSRISKSYSYFPIQLQRCFYKIRQYLEHVGKPDMGDNLISSCIFLRYLCPAILSPSLFNLTDEYPSERANRNLTLVAKTLQTLANFTRYEGKENAMEFLNSFLEEESVPMKNFLRQISSPLAEDGWIPNLTSPLEKTDLGRHLSCLHTILSENISKIEPQDDQQELTAERLRHLLDEINGILRRPTIPELEQISQPTMTTLEKLKNETIISPSQQQQQPQQQPPPGSKPSTSSLFWTSWTLPKPGRGKQQQQQQKPAVQQQPQQPPPMHIFAKPEAGISMSSDTSSSTSLSPSPGVKNNWTLPPPKAPSSESSSSSSSVPHHKHPRHSSDLPQRRLPAASKSTVLVGKYHSTMSLDDTDSSDDSTYSSQYQSDATSTPKCNTSASHTLPRPVMGSSSHGYERSRHHKAVIRCQGAPVAAKESTSPGKSLSDYEREILELRSAMETLQMKLGEAERKLQERDSNEAKEEDQAKEIVGRLSNEEEDLRRDVHVGELREKEKMIAMQQQKVAAIDEANYKLMDELNRMAEEQRQQQQQQQPQQEIPKSVDELLDSLHSTPI